MEFIRKTKQIFLVFVFGVMALFLFSTGTAYAKTDLSVLEKDITFSKENSFAGQTIKIFARIYNNGDTDVIGQVAFFINGKQFSTLQPISVRIGSYDDVFVDWKTEEGKYNIEAKIASTSITDENPGDNNAVAKEYFVDLDTDGDGIGDSTDTDDDNDGVLDIDEVKAGTSPIKADTDNDGVNDKVDAFPKDATEWRDTNNNSIGDNKDPDIDGDGLTNEQEKEMGTNPLVADNPINSSKATTASIASNPFLASLLNSNTYVYWAIGVPLGLIILYFLFRRKRRRK